MVKILEFFMTVYKVLTPKIYINNITCSGIHNELHYTNYIYITRTNPII